MELAAILAATLLAVIGLFQLALAAGAPLGQAAWGGTNPGVLPTRLRVASGVAGVFVYPALVLLVLASADLVAGASVPGAGELAMWLLTGFFALGTVMNAVSRSTPERVWAPVSLVVAVCCAVVARGL